MFYPGQPVVTRANNRTLRYGADERVRNGDRWTVNAGTRDELYLTNTGDRLALPGELVNGTREQGRREQVTAESGLVPTGNSSDRAAATAERFRRFRFKR